MTDPKNTEDQELSLEQLKDTAAGIAMQTPRLGDANSELATAKAKQVGSGLNEPASHIIQNEPDDW